MGDLLGQKFIDANWRLPFVHQDTMVLVQVYFFFVKVLFQVLAHGTKIEGCPVTLEK
jgi:hypothetical protein